VDLWPDFAKYRLFLVFSGSLARALFSKSRGKRRVSGSFGFSINRHRPSVLTTPSIALIALHRAFSRGQKACRD
jgi:hypothetical protein